MKWIKIKKAFGTHKVGDLMEVDDAVSKAYIDQDMAEDGTKAAEDALKNLGLEGFGVAMKGFGEAVTGAVTAQIDEIKKTLKLPTIEPGQAEADKKKSLGNFVQLVTKAADYRDLAGMQKAQEELGKVYAADKAKGMTESEGVNGGYWTVPEEFSTEIMKEAASEAIILPGATVVPMGAKGVSWPALDQYQAPEAGNSAMYGGVTCSRKGENSRRDPSKPQAKKIKLECNDLTAYTSYSRDLDMDSSATLSTMLVELIGGAIGFRRDYEHHRGSGAGQCLGVINSKAMIRLPRKTAGGIDYRDLTKMVSRLSPGARKAAIWVAHPFMYDTLQNIKDDSGRLIMMPTMTSAEGPLATASCERMLNRPIFWSEHMGAPGDDFDIMLVDRKRYLVGERAGLEIGLSEHFLFDTDEIALRAKIRDDGQPAALAPFFLADGKKTNQVSPFVGLQAGTA